MIYVFVESQNNTLKKSAFETLSYAKTFGEEVTAICVNADDASELKKYGADKIIAYKNDSISSFSFEALCEILVEESADGNLILSHSSNGSNIAAKVAMKKGVFLLTNAINKPISTSPLQVQRKAFSGKAVMTETVNATGWVLTLAPKSFGAVENEGKGELIQKTEVPAAQEKENLQSLDTIPAGKIDLKEAEYVVSAGRGLKGPENWGMIEELAETLNAATACSKPVSDLGWRPHSEHVGQTGKAIAPDLYIAVGISGAIQHLAGVNRSKTIVVVNIDPEAPFFKAADYGVVGDAFEVIPELNKKIKEFKAK